MTNQRLSDLVKNASGTPGQAREYVRRCAPRGPGGKRTCAAGHPVCALVLDGPCVEALVASGWLEQKTPPFRRAVPVPAVTPALEEHMAGEGQTKQKKPSKRAAKADTLAELLRASIEEAAEKAAAEPGRVESVDDPPRGDPAVDEVFSDDVVDEVFRDDTPVLEDDPMTGTCSECEYTGDRVFKRLNLRGRVLCTPCHERLSP